MLSASELEMALTMSRYWTQPGERMPPGKNNFPLKFESWPTRRNSWGGWRVGVSKAVGECQGPPWARGREGPRLNCSCPGTLTASLLCWERPLSGEISPPGTMRGATTLLSISVGIGDHLQLAGHLHQAQCSCRNYWSLLAPEPGLRDDRNHCSEKPLNHMENPVWPK